MTTRISVIIPTFNRAEMLCRCVQSVLDTKWPTLEIIIVDDCSPDDTGEKIKAQFGPDVRYIRNKKNSFQAISRNNGAKIATGDFLFFLDDDNIADKDIFRELMRAFEGKPLAMTYPLATAFSKRRTTDAIAACSFTFIETRSATIGSAGSSSATLPTPFQ
ncbi:MAG: glycosyltransferase family 2 protein [Kiritimatiellae bacterium]|nr:glycosyltransferase family 2 protein [Kiritimatiellia bacterium]